ncbi:MAG TPA: exosortase/archaeosortase family protein, partial [Acidimicrobiales bacterium]|nr:exosortase/archaeosortase family protein [Acidimicrobiales bacterium]
TQTTAKVLVLVGATVIAFHYSLTSLIQTVGLDTPLAYVGLVPFLAAGLAWIKRAPRVSEPPIHDRQLDYFIGTPLVVAPMIGAVVLPERLGAMYWVNRIDLVLLPIYVAGATIVLFGVRTAWRQRVALAYLLLAWPWLYTSILLGTLGGFTALTLRGLHGALDVVHVATPVGGAANAGVFEVAYRGHEFPVSVVTACSGVDGMVGFLLIGAALAAVVGGSALRKTLWLATGLVLLWVANLARLLLIFWVGSISGEHVALGYLHPVAGLVVFCLGVGLMTALLRPFGLRALPMHSPPPPAWPGASSPDPISTAAPGVFVAAALVLVAALVLSVSDGRLRVYNPVASAAGEPRIGSFLADPAVPPGWTSVYQTEYLSNKALFGEDSRWFRYLYVQTDPGLTSLHSTLAVTADVIDAGSLGGFNAYGVTACYSFHGYNLRDVADVGLGDGIVGQALSYWGGTSDQDWSIVYWIWPVQTGGGTRYERVILYVQNTASGTVALDRWPAGVARLTPSQARDDPILERLDLNRALLVALARQIVAGQAHQQDTGVFIASVLPPNTGAARWAVHTRYGAGSGGRGISGVTADATGGSSTTGASQQFAQFWLAYNHDHSRPGVGTS